MLDFVNALWLRVANRDREEGQALVEYALILTLVSVVSIGALAILGGKITDILGDVTAAL
jgi:Flp pilus assembly pilin Flp